MPIEIGPGGLSAALPALLAALGERLPTDSAAVRGAGRQAGRRARPDADRSHGSRPRRESAGPGRRPRSIYEPAEPARAASRAGGSPSPRRSVRSRRTTCGGIWRATTSGRWACSRSGRTGIERKLPEWGRDLFQAALGDEEAREALSAWQHAADGAERRFSVLVDSDLPKGAPRRPRPPRGRRPPSCWRCPGSSSTTAAPGCSRAGTPCASAGACPTASHSPPGRPPCPSASCSSARGRRRTRKGNRIGYIDHRISARPLTEAVESLGDLARLTVLQPPTYARARKGPAGRRDRGRALRRRPLRRPRRLRPPARPGRAVLRRPRRRGEAGGADAGLRGRRPARRPGPPAPHPAGVPGSLPDRGGRGGPDRLRGRAAARRGGHLGGGDEPQRAGGDRPALRAGVLRRAGRRRAGRPGDARRPAGAVRRHLRGARSWAPASCGSRTGSCRCSTRKSRTRSSSPRSRRSRSGSSKRRSAG